MSRTIELRHMVYYREIPDFINAWTAACSCGWYSTTTTKQAMLTERDAHLADKW